LLLFYIFVYGKSFVIVSVFDSVFFDKLQESRVAYAAAQMVMQLSLKRIWEFGIQEECMVSSLIMHKNAMAGIIIVHMHSSYLVQSLCV
jgi:hypothetical protein